MNKTSFAQQLLFNSAYTNIEYVGMLPYLRIKTLIYMLAKLRCILKLEMLSVLRKLPEALDVSMSVSDACACVPVCVSICAVT